jgi:hypothetical protein
MFGIEHLPMLFNLKILKREGSRLKSVPNVPALYQGERDMGDALKSRLAVCRRVLDVIDQRRLATGDPHIGAAVERLILDRELRELEGLAEGEQPVRTPRRARRK